MNARAPIALAIVVALLGGYILLFERDQAGTSVLNQRRKHLLPAFSELRVKTVRFDDGVTLRSKGEGFERRWLYEDGTLANEDAVDAYLGNWEHAVPMRRLTVQSEADLAVYGLDKPQARVVLGMPASAIEVELGSKAGVDGSRYVRINGATEIFTVESGLKDAVVQSGAAFKTRPDGGTNLDHLSKELNVDAGTP